MLDEKRVPKRKRQSHQVNPLDQLPYDLRLLTSHDAEDEQRMKEFEEEQSRETLLRLQRQAEKDR